MTELTVFKKWFPCSQFFSVASVVVLCLRGRAFVTWI